VGLRKATRDAARSWCYRPPPLADETLSSWLIRVAQGMRLRPITFLNAVWGTGRSLVNQDLDNFAPELVVTRIVTATDISEDALRMMTLAEYEGRLFERFPPKGRKTWILPVRVVSNDRRRHGLQYCPACLRDDPVPYLRRTWRLAFATGCTCHGIALHDACPACGATVQPYRARAIELCYRCARPLADASHTPASAQALRLQRRCETALKRGWDELGEVPLYSHLSFMIIRQVAALLVNGPRAGALRQATSRAWSGDPAPFAKPTARQPIEYLGIEERARLFDLVGRLLDGFPFKLVHACLEARIGRFHATKDMDFPPSMWVATVRLYLDLEPYKASEAEVAAAAAWLRRTKGSARYRDLKALCGESRTAIYRHMDYERSQARPSWRAGV